jgi:hypothetical protein
MNFILRMLIIYIVVGIPLYNLKLFFIKNKHKLPFYNFMKRYLTKNIIVCNSILPILIIVLVIFLELFDIQRGYIVSLAILFWYILVDGEVFIRLPQSKYHDLYEISIYIVLGVSEYFSLNLNIDGLYIIAFNFILYKHIRIE